jgi:hypothetical protein
MSEATLIVLLNVAPDAMGSTSGFPGVETFPETLRKSIL